MPQSSDVVASSPTRPRPRPIRCVTISLFGEFINICYDAANLSQRRTTPTNLDPAPQRFHHRLAVSTPGRPLDTFTCSKQLMQAVSDAFNAHRHVYERCGIVHRDISPMNMYIDATSGRGILNDWDLATHEHGKRPRERTKGTREFMSSQLLMDITKQHTFQDDLESFVYVVLYLGLRYLKHNLKPHDLRFTLKYVFRERDREMRGWAKEQMIRCHKYIGRDFAFAAAPLTRWVKNVFFPVAQYHEYLKPPRPIPKWLMKDGDEPELEREPRVNRFMADHSAIAMCFEVVLKDSGWLHDDRGGDAFVFSDAVEDAPRKVWRWVSGEGHRYIQYP
ncbi:hypothetical protein Hypma_014855 [Hypsizygus marmoreus]|uniref:Protein kinase domain-containing protein n=1 Tax=Hypsizygus marmoreus TaxID=39966 RepID=A0A369K909_HYPMA|nr:hypothetical protein Hypma_014855 [Hypsizygus marmoreus]